MAGNQTQGFDVAYEISTDRFVDILHDLFIDILPLKLSNLPLSLPLTGGLVQTGSFSLPSAPTVVFSLFPPIASAFNLTLTFPNSTLSLNAVGINAGLPPTPVGNTVVILRLNLDTTAAGNKVPFALSTIGSISVSGPDTLPASVNAVAAAIRSAVSTLVGSAVGTLFPLVRNIGMPTSGPCGIFPRLIATKFLPGSGGAPDALGFFLPLEQSTINQGNVNAITNSALAAGTDAVLTVANNLLLDIVACLLPQSGEITGLTGAPQRVQTADETCRTWTNLGKLSIGSSSFDSAPKFEVCIKNGGLQVDGELHTSGTGWHAEVTFSLGITLQNQAGQIAPVIGTPVVNVDTHVEWWVWVLALIPVIVATVVGAIVGAGVGGIAAGAGIGFLIGALISAPLVALLALFEGLLGTVLGGALGSLTGLLGNLQILPSDLANLIGGLDLVGNPIVDDVRIRGKVVRTPGLTLSRTWGYARGKAIDVDHEEGITITEFERSATGHFTATPTRLVDPIQYQWAWNGAHINGSGTLPGTQATFNILTNRCELKTAMGVSLAGTLSVTATGPGGRSASASAKVDVLGTEFVVTGKGKLGQIAHGTPRLEDQLHGAISHGTGVGKNQIQLK